MIDLVRKPRLCFICKQIIVRGVVGQIENDYAHYVCVAIFLREAMANG